MYNGYPIALIRVDLGQDFRVSEQQGFLFADLDRRSAVWRNQDGVAWLDGWSNSLAIFAQGAWTDTQYLCFIQFLDVLFWDVDTRCSFGFGLCPLDQHSVEQWDNVLE